LREVVPYDTASVQLLRENCLEIVGGRGFSNLEELLGVTFDPSREDNPNREVIRTGTSFIVEDAPTMYEEFSRDPHAAAGIRSWLGVPMVMGERLIGMIALDRSEPGFYTQEHARLAETFAAQAGIAIENARLHQEVLDHAEQLEQGVRERTAELQAQYARLDAILNSTTDGIVVADGEGSIVQTNPVAQAWLTETLPLA
jgi:GAF domain-containing protein